MPWKETCAVELREALVLAMLRGDSDVSELCRRAGVSRKTAYKWQARYALGGLGALGDQSRTRCSQDHAVAGRVLDLIMAVKASHPTWGAKKILPHLSGRFPRLHLPCESTIGEILRRAGLTVPNKPKARHRRPVGTFEAAEHPNQVWTIDFKGEFRLGCREWCYPLTVADAFSRYLLCVDSKPGTKAAGVVTSMERLFGEYGLPERIKSDNGSPFASIGIARLSSLSVWFLSLGVQLERIAPGKPGQNGSHERMHRTLKAQTARPPAQTWAGQQRRFTKFRREYNDVRPHEGIGQRTPASLYAESARTYRASAVQEDVYPGHWERRYVRHDGTIKWKGGLVYLSTALAKWTIGLVESTDDLWEIHFQWTLIGILDDRGRKPLMLDAMNPLSPAPS